LLDEIWQPYVDKMRQVEIAVKLTAFHTQECVNATEEVVHYTEKTVDKIKEYLGTLNETYTETGNVLS
jgi:hypothetical protein